MIKDIKKLRKEHTFFFWMIVIIGISSGLGLLVFLMSEMDEK